MESFKQREPGMPERDLTADFRHYGINNTKNPNSIALAMGIAAKIDTMIGKRMARSTSKESFSEALEIALQKHLQDSPDSIQKYAVFFCKRYGRTDMLIDGRYEMPEDLAKWFNEKIRPRVESERRQMDKEAGDEDPSTD